MATRILISVLLFVVIFLSYLQVDAALDTIHRHAPDPEKLIRVGKIEMRQIDALCHELIPRMHPPPSDVQSSLICYHYRKLVPLLFILASLTGWCASVWLLAIQRASGAVAESWAAFLASLLLALVVGLACYLILIAPFALFKGDMNKLETAAVFPLLGGLFMRTFFERLSGVLTKIFDMLGSKEKDNNDKTS
jgi:hypothetical protein